MAELVRHHRHSIQLRGYNYSPPGAYFVTICLQGMTELLGEISEGQMKAQCARQYRAVVME